MNTIHDLRFSDCQQRREKQCEWHYMRTGEEPMTNKEIRQMTDDNKKHYKNM